MKNLAVFASGSGTNYEAIVKACVVGELDAQVVLLVCDQPKAYVLTRAKAYGTPVFAFQAKDYGSKAEYEQQIASLLDRYQVDWVCLAGYMRLIGSTLLSQYGGRIINIHPSLLPAFKGKDAVEQALAYGAKVLGVTVHYVDESLDGGKIIAQRAYSYEGTDVEEAHRLGHEIEHVLYVDTIRSLIAKKTVLVIGSGGREHAIVDALHRSGQVGKIYCASGNEGIASQAELVNISDTNVDALLQFAMCHKVDLTVVGPEAALAAGVVDRFREAGLVVFGHMAAAARIESSKEFAKQVMEECAVPTASYQVFTNYDKALSYVDEGTFPAVIKYDGLAAGKGVVIAQNMDEAEKALREMLLDEVYGTGRVVVEEYLEGPEFSFMCFVSGTDVYPMPLAQDHKCAFDGDKGPNTGGMGAYTPLPFISVEDEEFALQHILIPVARTMADRGLPLTGVLYGGLMKTKTGIKVIEFNARFGDPETEVVLPLLKTDAYEVFHAMAVGDKLSGVVWEKKAVIGVVLASKGYPGKYVKGVEIKGVDRYDGTIYHMGTKQQDGRLLTNGGRVMMCLQAADTLEQAHRKVYEEIQKVECENLYYRTDIAHIALPNL